MHFALAPRSDILGLRETYRLAGSVSLPSFLPLEQARDLQKFLVDSQLWLEIFKAGEKVFEMPMEAFGQLDPRQREKLELGIHQAARRELQYRYRTIRVPEEPAERRLRGSMLDSFADFLNSREVLDLVREITGQEGVTLLDAQATDYRAGDFLTSHDDAVEGKNRRAAYVYSLTDGWRGDFGGLLLFEEGAKISGYVPDFNGLRIFQVPTVHHVSVVAPWVTLRRVSVTGWLRESGQ